MKVMLWLQTPQMPMLGIAINVVARTYGALDFVGVISSLPNAQTQGGEKKL